MLIIRTAVPLRCPERNFFRFCAQRNARRDLEKFLAIAARQVCDGTNYAFAPKISIWKRGDVAHVNAATNNDAALGEGAQSRRNECADRSEDNCGVEFFRRHFIGAASPDRTQ